jgi:acyl carrier protein
MLGTAPEDIEQLVHRELERVLSEKNRPNGPMEASSRLGPDLGLESLDLALVVARLELATGLDPFAEDVPITSVRTVGDVVTAYQKTGSAAPGDPHRDDDLVAVKRRTLSRGGRATSDGARHGG